MNSTIRIGLLPFAARLFVVSEFLVALNGKLSDWDGQAAYMTAHGMHFVPPLLAAATLIELLGSICLIAGFRARTAAAVMFFYLGIVSVRLHGFWNQTGNAAGMNETHFFKNLGMMGGLLMIVAYGSGTWTLGRGSSAAGSAEQRDQVR